MLINVVIQHSFSKTSGNASGDKSATIASRIFVNSVMPDKRCAKAIVQDLSRALGCDSATGKIAVRFPPTDGARGNCSAGSFETIRSPHAQRPPLGGLVQTELWEMAVQLRYVRDHFQLLPTVARMGHYTGVQRTSKGF